MTSDNICCLVSNIFFSSASSLDKSVGVCTQAKKEQMTYLVTFAKVAGSDSSQVQIFFLAHSSIPAVIWLQFSSIGMTLALQYCYSDVDSEVR